MRLRDRGPLKDRLIASADRRLGGKAAPSLVFHPTRLALLAGLRRRTPKIAPRDRVCARAVPWIAAGDLAANVLERGRWR